MTVNLLPGTYERMRVLQRRWAAVAVALVVLWIALGALVFDEQTERNQLLAERNDAADRVALLDAQVESLSALQDLADRLAVGNETLAYVMDNEVSWARILVELSRGVPATTSFTSIHGRIEAPDNVSDDDAIFVADDDGDLGFFVLNGYDTGQLTGIQELLRRFGELDGFSREYLNTVESDSIGNVPINNFSAEVRLEPSARTNRYELGLPVIGG